MYRILCHCSGCNAAILFDSWHNVFTCWEEILSTYGFRSVAMFGGWEKLGLDRTVASGSPEAASWDAVFVGNLLVPEKVCPRCGARIYDDARRRAMPQRAGVASSSQRTPPLSCRYAANSNSAAQ